ncbi:MAG: CU044_5270 family protein [Acidimicrobiales bacterium]
MQVFEVGPSECSKRARWSARSADFHQGSTPATAVREARRRRRTILGGMAAAGVLLAAAALPDTLIGRSPSAAALVLDEAATAATSQAPLPPLGAGQYYYQANIELQGCAMQLPDGTFVRYSEPDTHKNWVASDGTGSVQLVADPGGRWVTPQDQARWQAAGSPRNDCVQTTGMLPSSSDAAILALPTDPKVLGSLIAQGRVDDIGQIVPSPGHCTPSQTTPGAATRADYCTTERQFDLVNNLLGSPVAVKKLGAVLYQILSQLPGVEVVGTRTDALGRAGTAVEDPSSGDVIVLDPSTGTLLETQSLAQAGSPDGITSGTVVGSTTFGPVSVVNGLGTLPG